MTVCETWKPMGNNFDSLNFHILFQAIKEFVRTVSNLPGSYDEAGVDGTKKAIKFLLARKFDVPRAVELYRCHQVRNF